MAKKTVTAKPEGFPVRRRIVNNTPGTKLFPVVDAVVPAHKYLDVEIADQDTLTRLVADVETIAGLHGGEQALAVIEIPTDTTPEG